jgi:uncharacterized protein
VVAACTAQPAVLDGFARTEANVGERVLTVLVADTPSLRDQGLRGVEALPDEVDGMLFVFEEPRPATFGMRDTLIPLDIWWFDAGGVLLGSARMEPCLSPPCPSYGSPGPISWALETPAGEVDLSAGDRLVFDTP